jgi:hypothetical protein
METLFTRKQNCNALGLIGFEPVLLVLRQTFTFVFDDTRVGGRHPGISRCTPRLGGTIEFLFSFLLHNSRCFSFGQLRKL